MPEKEPKLEFHEELEKDIKELSKELRAFRSEAESKKEALKQALGTRIYEEKKKIAGEGANFLPHYLEMSPSAVKLEVEQLIDKTWHKGVKNILSEARKSGALILDAFHDSLVDRFYAELEKRGLTKSRPSKTLIVILVIVAAAFVITLLLWLL